ncbi:chromobox protein homolog 1-like [Macrosteles quadrilineatus]|uniref:chromobox protein homolog 1-like n=1 Tax=Macrosteles quadrilineatus TaxID=74068 RepID=UPI0023E12F5B|nr:chromobox protein homolog 1-like [Macrosteles quadrilineatus]
MRIIEDYLWYRLLIYGTTEGSRTMDMLKSKVKASTFPDHDNCSEAGGEQEYPVEQIKKKRIVKGKNQYFIKWKGYPDSENSWEPTENLHCPGLIKQFEENLKKKKDEKPSVSEASKNKSMIPYTSSKPASKRDRKDDKDKDMPKPSKQKKVENEAEAPKGFDKKLIPEKIIDADKSNGELVFWMKWKGTKKISVVPAKEANLKFPQNVIKFYEERLDWIPPLKEPYTHRSLPCAMDEEGLTNLPNNKKTPGGRIKNNTTFERNQLY